jgi:hypothetical protein
MLMLLHCFHMNKTWYKWSLSFFLSALSCMLLPQGLFNIHFYFPLAIIHMFSTVCKIAPSAPDFEYAFFRLWKLYSLTNFFCITWFLEAHRVAQTKLLGEIAGLLFKNSKVLDWSIAHSGFDWFLPILAWLGCFHIVRFVHRSFRVFALALKYPLLSLIMF